MTTVIEIALFILGAFLGVFWFSVIFLPLFYGLPRAVWWCVRGQARWRAPFAYLVPPVLWNVLFLGVAFVLVIYFRQTADYLMASGSFAVGQTVGVALAVGRAVFSRSAHRDIDADFLSFARPYLTGGALPLDDAAIAEDVAQMETVVRDFGGLMERIDPLSFYDVSVLPHPKSEILRALLVAIRVSQDAREREHLESALSCLACFQGDVGPEPISVMPVDLEALNRRMQSGEITDAEAADEISKASARVDQEKLRRLQKAYRDDVERFRAMARTVKE